MDPSSASPHLTLLTLPYLTSHSRSTADCIALTFLHVYYLQHKTMQNRVPMVLPAGTSCQPADDVEFETHPAWEGGGRREACFPLRSRSSFMCIKYFM